MYIYENIPEQDGNQLRTYSQRESSHTANEVSSNKYVNLFWVIKNENHGDNQISRDNHSDH